jgi:branched-chain amino acid transport system substrate-binding protein
MKRIAINITTPLGCNRKAWRLPVVVCWLVLCGLVPGLLPSIASAQRRIQIATILASSGPAAAADAPSLQGVRWAVSEINAAGGVLGRPLEVIAFDTRSTPIGAKVAAEQAAASFALAIIGPGFSSQALAAARVAQAKSIAMISNTATIPALTRMGNYIFRVCFSDDQQARVMGQFAYQTLNYRNVVTMVDISSDYSLGLVEMFEEAFLQQGGIILSRTRYKARQSNFRNIVKRAKRANPDAVFIGGHDESARIIIEADHYGLEAVPLGGDGWDTASFYHLGGKNIRHGYYTTHWHEAVDTETSKKFVARYRTDDILLAPTALSYDAVKLLAESIERAGSTDRSAIRDALANTRQFKGVTGTLSFNKYGDPIKTIILIKISDGHPYFLKQVRPEH